MLFNLRQERRISLRQVADGTRVNVSVAARAERGLDAKLSTWERLFYGVRYGVVVDFHELCEEVDDLISEERWRRRERQLEGLFRRGWCPY
jgi:transcriptional regulator with XRE-family HTH domain